MNLTVIEQAFTTHTTKNAIFSTIDMRIKLLFICMLVLSVNLSAQDSNKNCVLIPAEINGKCGMINETGKWIIQPKYDDVTNFSDIGQAIVKQNDKYGIINESGKIIIKPKYETVFHFSENGLACIKRKGKWGYINMAGKMAIKAKYDEAEYYFQNNGLACVCRKGKYGCINKHGKTIIKPKYDDSFSFSEAGLARIELKASAE